MAVGSADSDGLADGVIVGSVEAGLGDGVASLVEDGDGVGGEGFGVGVGVLTADQSGLLAKS